MAWNRNQQGKIEVGNEGQHILGWYSLGGERHSTKHGNKEQKESNNLRFALRLFLKRFPMFWAERVGIFLFCFFHLSVPPPPLYGLSWLMHLALTGKLALESEEWVIVSHLATIVVVFDLLSHDLEKYILFAELGYVLMDQIGQMKLYRLPHLD